MFLAMLRPWHLFMMLPELWWRGVQEFKLTLKGIQRNPDQNDLAIMHDASGWQLAPNKLTILLKSGSLHD